jgi:hypothetical protein
VELSSGDSQEIMICAFEIAGYMAAEVEARFGGTLNASLCGARRH